MFYRTIQEKILQASKQIPVITITGPRQSGKTTMAKHIFPNHTYINLESPREREFATLDPQAFFNAHPNGLILDEVQRAPHLLSYIQVIVDESNQNGQSISYGLRKSVALRKSQSKLSWQDLHLYFTSFKFGRVTKRAH